MQVPNYMCPSGSYYDMTIGACVPISTNAFGLKPDFFEGKKPLTPEELGAILSPNEAVAKEIAMRSVKPAI